MILTREIILLLALSLTGCVVYSYTIGAPDSACMEMIPGHRFEPQTESPSPALLRVSSALVGPGEEVEVLLEANNNNAKFKGFILQVRDVSQPDIQVGSFVAGDEAKYMTCGRGIHNSLTHRSSAEKESVAATWRAPSNFEGEVMFVYSVLRDFSTYWVKIEGAKVKVTSNPTIQDIPALPEVDVAKEKEAGAAGEKDTVLKEQDVEDILKELDVDVLDEINNAFDLEEKDEEPVTVKDHDHVKPTLASLLEEIKEKEDKELIQELDFPQPSQKAEEPLNLASNDNQAEAVDTYTPIYISSTTTLRTTTTTTEPYADPLPIIDGVLQHTDPKDEIYEGCSTTKSCFGIPRNCVETGKCVAVVSYRPDRFKYHFEMKALSSGYVSFGLSRDGKMGEDLTTNCVLKRTGNVDISTGYNYGKSGNRAPANLTKKMDGIADRLASGRRDGWVYCSWARNTTAIIEKEVWDLDRDKFFIMLAVGNTFDSRLQYHTTKAISGTAMGLGEVGVIATKSRLYIVLHGSFMIGAWLCAASLGMLIARYFKQTWTSCRMFSLDQWFVLHRSLMILVWCLTIIGVVLMFLDLGGITSTIFTNPHAILGFITLGLAFIQPFIALMRCNPMHSSRWIFDWTHWLIGNTAHILSILCLFFAVDLEKAELPRPETDYLLLAFLGFHILIHILMSFMTCLSDNKVADRSMHKFPVRHPGRHNPIHGHAPYPDYEELKRDAPGSGLRIFTLVVYTIVNVLVTTALILLVALAPARSTLVNIGILSA